MGWASGFSAGSQLGRTLVDTYQSSKDYEDKQKKKDEIAAIVAAQQLGTGGNLIEGTPEAVQAQLDSGAGMGEARKLVSLGTTPTEYSFLGKTSATPLDDAGQASARMQAMAGVMEKFGNPEEAMRYRQQAQQGLRDEQRFKQEGTQFEWATKNQAYTEKARQREDAYQAGIDRITANSPYAKAQTDYQSAQDAYQAQMKDYVPGSGPAPTPPTLQNVTPGQEIGHASQIFANELAHGKVNAESALKFHHLTTQIKKEGYGDALTLANSGAPIAAVAEAFNKNGNIKFDPASVVSDKITKNADGIPTRIIQVQGPDGSIQTIDTLAELNGIGAADKVYSQFYRKHSADVEDKNLGLHQQSVGIQSRTANASIAQSEAGLAEITQRTQDKKDLADIHDDLNSAIDKGDAKAEDAARKKLTTYMVRSRGTGMGTLEMNANLYLASGKAKNMSEALDMAHSKVQSTPKDDYIKLTTGAMPRSQDDLNRDMTAMHGANWREKMNPTVVASATFATQADADVAVKAGKLKSGDKVSIGGRIATWNQPAVSAPPPTVVTDTSRAVAAVPSPASVAATVGTSPDMEKKHQSETREMNDFKRTAFSPDVQAYLDKKNADQAAIDKAESDAYRAKDFKRAQSSSFR